MVSQLFLQYITYLRDGYESFSRVRQALFVSRSQNSEEELSTRWQSIRFCIFGMTYSQAVSSVYFSIDAPYANGNYQTRREYIKNAIKDCDSTVILIPSELCLGVAHLEKKLQEVIGRKGDFALYPVVWLIH